MENRRVEMFWSPSRDFGKIEHPSKTYKTEEKLEPAVLKDPMAEEKSVTCGIDSLPLGMSYVPWQKWGKTYDAETGLERGTIFPELDLPFIGEGANRK